jgi:hypothetical protein
MNRNTSVAMTGTLDRELSARLLRPDGQEDLCLATYRRSSGRSRTTALLCRVIPPGPCDRQVHGNATVTGDYVVRAATLAQQDGCGVVLLHSHPGGRAWQAMSAPDQDAEASYANLVREITGVPLVGMTLAGADNAWSARHWDKGVGAKVTHTECLSVRVIDDRLAITWNDALAAPPAPNAQQRRTVSAWGPIAQRDLARRRILVVGAGSVGLDVIVRLAASGVQDITIMDFDRVKLHNLDRMIGACGWDVVLRRLKVDVAKREALRNATSRRPRIRTLPLSVCEPEGLAEALDHDLIFSCVDRPWARAVLNCLAYSDLIPVIDGGIAIDTRSDASMRNATWRSHVVRPGRPCMTCIRQLDMGQVALEIQGLLDDPEYVTRAGALHEPTAGQNVAPLSISVAAALLAQYVSFSVAPGGIGDPGPLQYVLSAHHLDHLSVSTTATCMYEPVEPLGDSRIDLSGVHELAASARHDEQAQPLKVRLLRVFDDLISAFANHSVRGTREFPSGEDGR